MGRPRMWSDKEFRERVALRAKAIGKSKRQILVAAGLALDTLEKIPARGRRLDTLEKISTALGWSLAETMGHDVIGRVTPELLGVAFGIANRGLRYRPHDEATVIGDHRAGLQHPGRSSARRHRHRSKDDRNGGLIYRQRNAKIRIAPAT